MPSERPYRSLPVGGRLRWTAGSRRSSSASFRRALGPTASVGCSSVLFLLGGVAGEREEHVVEGRAVQGDVADARCRRRRAAARRRQTPRAPSPPAWIRISPAALVHVGSSRCRRRQSRRAAAPVIVLSATWSSRTSPPILSFSSSAVPSAITVPEVDHRDPVGEVVGLLEVLRRQQHRLALAYELADHLPEVDPAPGVQAGGRLIEEQHVGRATRTGAYVEPPTHAAGVGLGGRSAASASPKPVEDLGRRRRGPPRREVVEPSDHLEVLQAGQVLVDRRRTGRPGRSGSGAPRRPARRRARRPPPARHRVAGAWSGCGRTWSCRRRSGPAARTRSPRHVEVDPLQRLDPSEAPARAPRCGWRHRPSRVPAGSPTVAFA